MNTKPKRKSKTKRGKVCTPRRRMKTSPGVAHHRMGRLPDPRGPQLVLPGGQPWVAVGISPDMNLPAPQGLPLSFLGGQ